MQRERYGGFIAKDLRIGLGRLIGQKCILEQRGTWIDESPVFLQNLGCWSGGGEGQLLRKRAEQKARNLSLSCSLL